VPLGLGLRDTFRAIPVRIELSGHGSSWTVTAGSFTAAVEFAAERFGSFAITGCRLRDGLWRRLTLWVSTDPADIARARTMRLERAVPLAVTGGARLLTPTEMADETPLSPAHGNGNGADPTVVEILSLEDHRTRAWGRRTRPAPELPPVLEGIFSRAEARRLARRVDALGNLAEASPGEARIPRQRDQDRAPGAEAPPVAHEGDVDEV
jgi:hypothetical protein